MAKRKVQASLKATHIQIYMSGVGWAMGGCDPALKSG